MNDALGARLVQVLPTLLSDDFLSGRGLGNEIGFFIFDYYADEELRVREFLRDLVAQMSCQKPSLKFCHINLFDFVVDYLRERNLLEKVIAMQKTKGDVALKKALSGPLHESKLVPVFASKVSPAENDLVLLSGIGSAFPLLRSHTLLNNLQPIMGKTPLVIFYPGKYDQQSLQLFGKIKSANYYRAFRLI